jgi:endoglucanase
MQHLKSLSEAVGVSGKEDAVRDLILGVLDDYANEGRVVDVRVDAMGSVTARQPGTTADAPRVLIAAHMDEVGFMVTGFDSEGLIRFTNIGGVDERILPGLRVRVGDDALPGVIIWTPIHHNHDQHTTSLSSLRIDIGANNKDDLNGKVKRGDRIAFDSAFIEVGAATVRGKAFDDRVGCALLLDLLAAGPYPVEIIAAFTVQEEIGLRGALVAAQTFEPALAFALEGTTAHDVPTPSAEPDEQAAANPTCKLGAGPVLTVIDSSLIVNPRLLSFMRATADRHTIPYQLKTRPGGGTDAGALHRVNGGAPAGVISIPCRYIHSPAAYLRRDDYTQALDLLGALLRDLSAEVIASFAAE